MCHVGLAILNVGGVAGDRKSLVQETLKRLCFLNGHVDLCRAGRVESVLRWVCRNVKAVATSLLGCHVTVETESETLRILLVVD